MIQNPFTKKQKQTEWEKIAGKVKLPFRCSPLQCAAIKKMLDEHQSKVIQ